MGTAARLLLLLLKSEHRSYVLNISLFQAFSRTPLCECLDQANVLNRRNIDDEH